ncbi:formylglycine-generating enzyme family protein [Limnochorda pilosa]|nr:SUMF1/EgtB/PvdO family nonheme iron enzyme [Limnochorda pilosa]
MRSIIQAPADPSEWSSWREQLNAWRQATRHLLRFSDESYRHPAFAWTASAVSCYFLIPWDSALWDPEAGTYRVDALLQEGGDRYGGYDSVLLWNGYPQLGFDHRSQFDFWYDMPGGLEGARELIRSFHKRGVSVFIPYLRWDRSTRRDERSDFEVLAELVKILEVDGVFLDTLSQGAPDLRRRLDGVRQGIAMIPENTPPVERLTTHHISWAQRFEVSAVPGVLSHKWLERRHMQHLTSRWKTDPTSEIDTAWMNGAGVLIWDNVFGSWVGWSDRSRSILRAVLPILRRWADLFSGEGWTPLVDTRQPGVYASLWEGQDVRLWTLVNGRDATVEGPLLDVPRASGAVHYFDLIEGRPAAMNVTGSIVTLSGRIGPRGVGCLMAAAPEVLGDGFQRFLAGQATVHARANFSPEPCPRHEHLLPVRPTRRYSRTELPDGMLFVPGGEVDLKVSFRLRECGFYEIAGQSPLDLGDIIERTGGLHRMTTLTKHVVLRPYALDATPVTNVQYARFLESTGYRPRFAENHLKHWVNGKPAEGEEDHPVVYVSLEDARAYARWAGKRLPTEEEWQWAAQGPEGWSYPWGDRMITGACNAGGATTTGVFAHSGRSWVGCYDMCGNVWEWTESERTNGRTRFCIVKGGSYHRACGSEWYADGGPQPSSFSAKFLLMWPGMDRCATVGFRCAVDVE